LPQRARWQRPARTFVAIARTQGGLEELDDEIRKDGAAQHWCRSTSPTSTASARLGAALHERHGKLDILVGNAASQVLHRRRAYRTERGRRDGGERHGEFQLIRCMEPLLKQSDAGRACSFTSGAANKATA